jgi:hypothetical protein
LFSGSLNNSLTLFIVRMGTAQCIDIAKAQKGVFCWGPGILCMSFVIEGRVQRH